MAEKAKTKKYTVRKGRSIFTEKGKQQGGSVAELTAEEAKRFANLDMIGPYMGDDEEHDDSVDAGTGVDGKQADGITTVLNDKGEVVPISNHDDYGTPVYARSIPDVVIDARQKPIAPIDDETGEVLVDTSADKAVVEQREVIEEATQKATKEIAEGVKKARTGVDPDADPSDQEKPLSRDEVIARNKKRRAEADAKDKG